MSDYYGYKRWVAEGKSWWRLWLRHPIRESKWWWTYRRPRA
jgi:hypothetical protein